MNLTPPLQLTCEILSTIKSVFLLFADLLLIYHYNQINIDQNDVNLYLKPNGLPTSSEEN